MEKQKINEVYSLYESGKYHEAFELNNTILSNEPNNIYAKRYASLLSSKINNKENKIPKVKGKQLKCPHCLSKISFSALSESQQNIIKAGKYNNLELKCPYCHTKFVLQKRKASSILGIKIGDTATIGGKKYRTTGYTEYFGRWYEGNESGGVKYLEWLLLSDDNSFLYISEGSSNDDGIWSNEFEISEKFIPKQIGNINYISGYAEINGTKKYLKETDKVSVKSVYGENSKNTTVGEKVELYDFGSFIIEKESSGSQAEVGFYKTKKVSGNQVASYFGKEYNKISDVSGSIGKFIKSDNVLGFVVVLSIFGIRFISLIPIKYIFLGIALIIFSVIFYIYKDKLGEKGKIAFYGLIGLPIFVFLIFQPIFNSILENKEKIEFSKLDNFQKVELNFRDPSVMQEIQTSSTSYDYGGVRKYYSKNIGLKFSIKTDEDRKVLNNIKNLDYENKIKKMFNGDFYKLK